MTTQLRADPQWPVEKQPRAGAAGPVPALAVSASVVNSLGLAAATLFVLVSSNLCVSLVRNVVSETIRLPVFIMIIAAAVTAIELLMQAFLRAVPDPGYLSALITTNCIILGRADAFAAKIRYCPHCMTASSWG